MLIVVIGVSVATAILAVVIAVCLTRYFLKRKKTQRRRENAQVGPTEGNEPDIVMYAVFDKTKKFNAGVISDNSPASKKDEHDINQEEGPSVDAGQFASSSSIVKVRLPQPAAQFDQYNVYDKGHNSRRRWLLRRWYLVWGCVVWWWCGAYSSWKTFNTSYNWNLEHSGWRYLQIDLFKYVNICS
uniref:Uncharacterized protein LOC111113630 n=1 Tax=Crassostrea virginica TaxID=6565 RepID=A0A8B8BXQ8_CRAVI|nr:uncharacterized protein LOC111113630 [Crassostrea virginica]